LIAETLRVAMPNLPLPFGCFDSHPTRIGLRFLNLFAAKATWSKDRHAKSLPYFRQSITGTAERREETLSSRPGSARAAHIIDGRPAGACAHSLARPPHEASSSAPTIATSSLTTGARVAVAICDDLLRDLLDRETRKVRKPSVDLGCVCPSRHHVRESPLPRQLTRSTHQDRRRRTAPRPPRRESRRWPGRLSARGRQPRHVALPALSPQGM
jgi:hypothetical protein